MPLYPPYPDSPRPVSKGWFALWLAVIILFPAALIGVVTWCVKLDGLAVVLEAMSR